MVEKKQQMINEDWASVPKTVRDACDAFVTAHLKHIAGKDRLAGLAENEALAQDAAFDAMEEADLERVKVEYKDGSKLLVRTLKKKLAIKALPKQLKVAD